MKNSPQRFSFHPLFQLALAYAAGVFISNVFSARLAVPISLCVGCSLSTVVLVARQRLVLAGLTVLSAFFFAGGSLALIEKRMSAPNGVKQLFANGVLNGEKQLLVTGVLHRPPEFARDRIFLVLQVESLTFRESEVKASGNVTLLANFNERSSEEGYRRLNLRYGARLRVKTSLNRIDKYRNPGVATIGEYLDRNGYDATGVVKTPTAIVRLDDADVFQPLAWLYRWRENVQREIDHRFSAETAGVLDAALLGNRYNLSKNTAERFREGGTFHVLVISGLHISFIGGIVFLLTQRFTRKRILQCLIPSLVVWGYTVAVGAGASVVRAALMFSFVALGAAVFRTGSALNALGGAVLILLIKSPKDLFDPSFQLTCLSVFAIVTLAWPLIQTFQAIGYWRPTRGSPHPPSCSTLIRTVCESLYWSEIDWQKEMSREPYQYRLFKTSVAVLLERIYLQRLLRYIFTALLVSVSVQIVLLPLLIVYFHRVSLSSLILNIVIGLLLAVLGFVALAALLISQLNVVIASPLITLANGIDWLMVHGVDPFTSIGLASLRLPEYTGWSRVIYLLYYAPLVPLLAALSRWRPLQLPTSNRRSRQKLIGFAVLLHTILLTTLLLQPFSAGRPDGKLHVDFLDVGQGDAALVTLPNGATVLVDGGGRPSFASAPSTGLVDDTANSFERESRSIGEMVTSEYLWWRGLDRVDYVLATHADADHIDGLNDVVRNFSVRSALVARTPVNDAEYIKFAQTLKATNTPVEIVQAGDELHFGDVTATVLWPSVSSDPNAPSRNNDSVVLRLQFGARSILLTGDIEKGGEAQILSSNTRLHADVVKVPHHGSRTSSTQPFVAATSPRVAIVSVGLTSMFGHPHKDVVDRWIASGAEVLTTGRSGTISVTTDGKEIWVKKFVE